MSKRDIEVTKLLLGMKDELVSASIYNDIIVFNDVFEYFANSFSTFISSR